jgi:hypothetical protein
MASAVAWLRFKHALLLIAGRDKVALVRALLAAVAAILQGKKKPR